MQNPDITIIVPVYNVEKYVGSCLKSVMQQASSDFKLECIIVDDCGSDNSMDVVRKTLADYDGDIEFRILKHEKNSGLSAARNTGIKAAKGDYITFLDSDDRLLPGAMAEFWRLVNKYPGVDIIQGEIQLDKPAKWYGIYLNVSACELPDYIADRERARHAMLFEMPVTAWAKLIRRHFIIDNDLFFSEGFIHEDDIWCVCASRHISSIAFCFIPVYFYNTNVVGSIMNGKDKTRSMSGLLKIIESAVDCFEMTGCKDYLIYVYKKLHINERRLRWPLISDKSSVEHQMKELKRKIDNSSVPVAIKQKCAFFVAPAFFSDNHIVRSIVNRLLDRKFRACLSD